MPSSLRSSNLFPLCSLRCYIYISSNHRFGLLITGYCMYTCAMYTLINFCFSFLKPDFCQSNLQGPRWRTWAEEKYFFLLYSIHPYNYHNIQDKQHFHHPKTFSSTQDLFWFFVPSSYSGNCLWVEIIQLTLFHFLF